MIHEGEIVMCDSLEKIKTSHHSITLRFLEPLNEKPDFPGALSVEGKEREWTVLCNGELNEASAKAQDMGCEVYRNMPPTLEDIFVARVGIDRVSLKEVE
jgi:hypothetical protein